MQADPDGTPRQRMSVGMVFDARLLRSGATGPGQRPAVEWMAQRTGEGGDGGSQGWAYQ